MKIALPATYIASCMFFSYSLCAAPIAGRIKQDAAHETASMERVSVAIGVESFERQVEASGETDARLRGESLFASISLDVGSNASVYLGLNHSSVDSVTSDSDLNDHQGADWFAGLQVNLWNYIHKRPDMPRGQLSIAFLTEYANYSASKEGAEADWNNIVVGLPFSYHIFTPNDVSSSLSSTAFFVGPVFSRLDGDYTEGGIQTSFSESENVGLMGGLDVFLSPNFVLGGQVQLYDEYSYSFNARYHF